MKNRVWISRGSCLWNCHGGHVIVRVIITIESYFWRERESRLVEGEFPSSIRCLQPANGLLPPPFFFAIFKLTILIILLVK